jgi:hypothetical protein
MNIAPPTAAEVVVVSALTLFESSSTLRSNLIWHAVRHRGRPSGAATLDEFDTEPNTDLTI